jgi:hypothetical protein
MAQQATVARIDPATGQPVRKVVNVGDQNAFAGGYSLEEEIKDPAKKYQTTYDIGGIRYGLNPVQAVAASSAAAGNDQVSAAENNGSSVTIRYPETNSVSDAYGKVLESRTTGVLTDEQIQAQERERIQAQIDALENYWSNTVLPDLQEEAQGRLGQSRAIQAAGGLMSSARGGAITNNTNVQNRKVQQAERTKIDAQISALYDNADTRAIDRAEKQATQLRSDQDAYYSYLGQQQEDAKSDLINIFASGASLEDLKTKNADKYQALLDNAGLDELQVDALYKANSPYTQGVTYEYKELKSGEVLKLGSDGTAETFRGAQLDGDWKLDQLSDGTLIKIDSKTGEIQQYGSKGQFAKPKSGGGTKNTDEDEKNYEKIISNFNSAVSDKIEKIDKGDLSEEAAIKSIKARYGDYYDENEIRNALGLGEEISIKVID